MKLMADSGNIEQIRVRVSPPVYNSGIVRRLSARFWLGAMFFCSRRMPGFVRATRGFFLWWAWNFSKVLQANTLANARHLLGPDSTINQRRRLGKQVVGSFYDFISDFGRATALSREQLHVLVDSIEGIDSYRRLRAERKGAIIATAHMGSFEVGMTALQEVEKRIHVVFQRDPNSLFETLRSDFRQRMGIIEAPVDDGIGVWLRLREALLADEVVAIQADRVMPGQVGLKTRFMDGHMLLPEGPAKLAAITGAPIVPVFVIRLADGRVRIFIEEAIRVSSADQVAIVEAIGKLAEVMERYVRQYPHQWLVVHRAWCEDISPEGQEVN